MSIPPRAIGAALFIHALWGGNPVAVKLGLAAFPPLYSGFLRFALACLCVAVWAAVARIPLRAPREEWPAIVWIGLLFTLQIALMNFGFAATTGTNSAVLISTNPLFGLLFAHFLIPGDRIRAPRALGAAVAFVGTVFVLTRGALPAAGEGLNAGDLIVLASAALLGLRLALSGRLLQRVNEVRLVFWMMLLSLPLFAIGGVAFETILWEQVGWVPVAGIVYQGAVVAGLAFTVNFYLIRRYTPSVMISFNFAAPVVGVALSIWILGEPVLPGVLAGMALVALGLALVTRR